MRWIVKVAAGALFSEANFYDLRTVENYANARFARDDGASSAELTVDGDGLVSTRGDIAGTGTYTLVADAVSPDFKGAARLELRLVLRGEGEFRSVDTIPLGRRRRRRWWRRIIRGAWRFLRRVWRGDVADAVRGAGRV